MKSCALFLVKRCCLFCKIWLAICIISQMGVTGIHSSYFIVWTLNGIFIQIVNFDKQLLNKVNTNYFVSHLYVQPFLNLNPLPIVETVILSNLKRVKWRENKRTYRTVFNMILVFHGFTINVKT